MLCFRFWYIHTQKSSICLVRAKCNTKINVSATLLGCTATVNSNCRRQKQHTNIIIVSDVRAYFLLGAKTGNYTLQTL